jgi:hypothetical protein
MDKVKTKLRYFSMPKQATNMYIMICTGEKHIGGTYSKSQFFLINKFKLMFNQNLKSHEKSMEFFS